MNYYLIEKDKEIVVMVSETPKPFENNVANSLRESLHKQEVIENWQQSCKNYHFASKNNEDKCIGYLLNKNILFSNHDLKVPYEISCVEIRDDKVYFKPIEQKEERNYTKNEINGFFVWYDNVPQKTFKITDTMSDAFDIYINKLTNKSK